MRGFRQADAALMRLDHGFDDGEADAVAARAGGEKWLENSLADVRRHARTVVADHDLRAAGAVRRASNSRSRSALAACSALVARFSTADTSDGALARTMRSGAWVRMVSRTPRRNAGPQPLRHLLQQRAHAHHLARRAAVRERQHVVDQLVELLEAADGLLGAARQILRGLRPGSVICEAYSSAAASGVRIWCASPAASSPSVNSRCWRARNTCIRCDSVTSVSSTTSPPLSRSRREMLTNLPLRSSVCSARCRAGVCRGALAARPRSIAEQGFAEQLARRRIAFLNARRALSSTSTPPGRPLISADKPRRQMLLAGMRLAQFRAQLRDLGAQRVECAGQLFRHRTEGEERRLQFGATVFDQLEVGGCHTGRRKQLLCLAGICSSVSTSYAKSGVAAKRQRQ